MWQRYRETRRLERAIAVKISNYRQPETKPRVEAPLGERYHRTFTGTYIGKKLVNS
jgi:hypothetical protein